MKNLVLSLYTFVGYGMMFSITWIFILIYAESKGILEEYFEGASDGRIYATFYLPPLFLTLFMTTRNNSSRSKNEIIYTQTNS